MPIPALYTFRRCPFAIRARMALASAGISFQVREVVLRNKPQHLLDVSAKATVPVLLLPDGRVIEESLDILHWALDTNDPSGWKRGSEEELSLMDELISVNDGSFKLHLDQYKYADRHPEYSRQHYRQLAEVTILELEQRLQRTAHLFGETRSFADIAIFPFVRQFANVEPAWFETAPYPHLKAWLSEILDSQMFESIMFRYKPWQPGSDVVQFDAVQDTRLNVI
jgi:glutathione S-transferase